MRNSVAHQIKYWNPSEWLTIANGHKHSAKIIKKEIDRLISKYPDFTPKEDYEFIALCQSYLLLIGLALENLVKGVIISRCNNYDDEAMQEAQKKELGWNKNHRIVTMIEKNYKPLITIEKETLKKIEKYLIWQSKYPVANNQDELGMDSLIRSKDDNVIISIYDGLKESLMHNFSINSGKYESWCESHCK